MGIGTREWQKGVRSVESRWGTGVARLGWGLGRRSVAVLILRQVRLVGGWKARWGLAGGWRETHRCHPARANGKTSAYKLANFVRASPFSLPPPSTNDCLEFRATSRPAAFSNPRVWTSRRRVPWHVPRPAELGRALHPRRATKFLSLDPRVSLCLRGTRGNVRAKTYTYVFRHRRNTDPARDDTQSVCYGNSLWKSLTNCRESRYGGTFPVCSPSAEILPAWRCSEAGFAAVDPRIDSFDPAAGRGDRETGPTFLSESADYPFPSGIEYICAYIAFSSRAPLGWNSSIRSNARRCFGSFVRDSISR